jgi:hypothetical protein
MGDHVKIKEKDAEGHEKDGVKKHLTMKYDLKVLRQFNAFEDWINDSLEELAGDGEAPTIEPTSFCGMSEDKVRKHLKKTLAAVAAADRDAFIDEFCSRLLSLPPDLLAHMKDQGL